MISVEISMCIDSIQSVFVFLSKAFCTQFANAKGFVLSDIINKMLRCSKSELDPKNLLFPACRKGNFSHSRFGKDRVIFFREVSRKTFRFCFYFLSLLYSLSSPRSQISDPQNFVSQTSFFSQLHRSSDLPILALFNLRYLP